MSTTLGLLHVVYLPTDLGDPLLPAMTSPSPHASLLTSAPAVTSLGLEQMLLDFWAGFPCPPPWNEGLLFRLNWTSCVSETLGRRLMGFMADRCNIPHRNGSHVLVPGGSDGGGGGGGAEGDEDEDFVGLGEREGSDPCDLRCKILAGLFCLVFVLGVLGGATCLWRRRRAARKEQRGGPQAGGAGTPYAGIHYASASVIHREGERPLPPCPPPGEGGGGLPRQLHSYVYDPRDSDSPPAPPHRSRSHHHHHPPSGFHLQLCPLNRRAAYLPVDPNSSPSRDSLGSEGDSAPYHVYDYISDTDSVRYRRVGGAGQGQGQGSASVHHEYAYCTCRDGEGAEGEEDAGCDVAGDCHCEGRVAAAEDAACCGARREGLTVNTSILTTPHSRGGNTSSSSSSGNASANVSSGVSSANTTPRQSEGYHSDHALPAPVLFHTTLPNHHHHHHHPPHYPLQPLGAGRAQHEVSRPYPRYPPPGTVGAAPERADGLGHISSDPSCQDVEADDLCRGVDLQPHALGSGHHHRVHPALDFLPSPLGPARSFPRHEDCGPRLDRSGFPLHQQNASGLRGLPPYHEHARPAYPVPTSGGGLRVGGGGALPLGRAGRGGPVDGGQGFFNGGLLPTPEDLAFSDPPPPYHDVCPLPLTTARPRREDDSSLRFVNVPGGTLDSEHEYEYPQHPAVSSSLPVTSRAPVPAVRSGYFAECFSTDSTV